jgi:internalin A
VFVTVRNIWGDSSDNLYVVDAQAHNVRKIASDGIITLLAGDAEGKAGKRGDGGDATSSRLNTPTSVGGDTNGNIFIASFNERKIRRVDGSSGIISSFAGTGISGSDGDGNSATSAQLNGPYGVFVDSAGSVYITERTNNKVRKVDGATQLITTVAGRTDNSAGDAGIDGPATLAQLNSPYQSWVDEEGNVYIVDAMNRKVKRVSAFSGQIVTVAGDGSRAYAGDGDFASASSIIAPRAVWGLNGGDIFIADSQACNIRRLTVNPIPTATPTQ